MCYVGMIIRIEYKIFFCRHIYVAGIILFVIYNPTNKRVNIKPEYTAIECTMSSPGHVHVFLARVSLMACAPAESLVRRPTPNSFVWRVAGGRRLR